MTARSILIFGATRRTGLETAKLLRAKGDRVIALVRQGSDTSALEAIGVEIIRGDAFDPTGLSSALKNLTVDAAVCSLGNTPYAHEKVDHIGVANVVDACKALGTPRFVLVSSIGAGDSRPALSPQAERFLGPVCALKTLGEDHLKRSGLPFTIVRPGGLGSGPASGRGILSENARISGGIHRAEVARLIVQCLDDPGTVGKVYSAIER